VARDTGVSTATALRTLNDTGQIAPATRKAIEEAIARPGYRPNTIARSLITKSTQTIAFLLPDIASGYSGWLVVEQNWVPGSDKDGAVRSRRRHETAADTSIRDSERSFQ
jgi:hypothetical protein